MTARATELVTLTLITRDYCHLCHEMEMVLRPLAAEFGVDVEVVDIDAGAHASLLPLYDELVPVLLHERVELCHYFLDVAKVRDYLSKIR